MCDDLFANHCWVSRTTVPINVGAIGLSRHRHDVCAKFVKYRRCNAISSTVGAVDNNFLAVQSKVLRESLFDEFDVTTGRVFQTGRTS